MIELKGIAGDPLTDAEWSQVVSLAFACPLEAGSAVYRARSVLNTTGSYVFDDGTNCETGKEDGNIKREVLGAEVETPSNQWQIYPNPTRHQLWITGSRIEELEAIQLFNGFGQLVLHQYSKGVERMEVMMPSELKAGIYFLRLQLRSGEIHTQKILLQS